MIAVATTTSITIADNRSDAVTADGRRYRSVAKLEAGSNPGGGGHGSFADALRFVCERRAPAITVPVGE